MGVRQGGMLTTQLMHGPPLDRHSTAMRFNQQVCRQQGHSWRESGLEAADQIATHKVMMRQLGRFARAVDRRRSGSAALDYSMWPSSFVQFVGLGWSEALCWQPPLQAACRRRPLAQQRCSATSTDSKA